MKVLLLCCTGCPPADLILRMALALSTLYRVEKSLLSSSQILCDCEPADDVFAFEEHLTNANSIDVARGYFCLYFNIRITNASL